MAEDDWEPWEDDDPYDIIDETEELEDPWDD